jgi:hypothetical protein
MVLGILTSARGVMIITLVCMSGDSQWTNELRQAAASVAGICPCLSALGANRKLKARGYLKRHNRAVIRYEILDRSVSSIVISYDIAAIIKTSST